MKFYYLESQRAFWNKVAYEKQYYVTFNTKMFAKFVQTNAYILDYGCGYGRILKKLNEEGYINLFGLDYSYNMLKSAKENCPNLCFIQNQLIDIPFGNERFDAVIISAVLGCVANNEDQKFLIDEVKRVLKPKGILYIADFLINSDQRNITRYNTFNKTKAFPYGVFRLPEGGILRHHEIRYIENLLISFKKKIFSEKKFRTMNDHISKGFLYIGMKR